MADDVVDQNDDLEVMFVADGEPIEEPAQVVETPPAGKTLTDEQYQELVRRGESASTLAAPLAGLVERMGQAQPPVNVQQPGETDDEFYARMEQEAFLPGKFGEVMKKVNERQTAPIVNRMAGIILGQAKQLMRVDPERGTSFRKYEKEIERVAERLPQTPDLYEKAYQQVMLEKQPEIFEEQKLAFKEQMKKELLAELGIDPATMGGKAQPARQAVQSLGQRATSGSGGAASGEKATLRLYESERQKMMDLGMDPKDANAVQSWLRNHPRRK